jgi:hypothetical protein
MEMISFHLEKEGGKRVKYFGEPMDAVELSARR